MSKPQIHLVRHAHAGKRAGWHGDDTVRPLTQRGQHQSDEIAAALVTSGATALWSSPYLRCAQTLLPLAAKLGLEVSDKANLCEGAWGADALDELLAAASEGQVVVASSHGDVLPEVIATAVRRGAILRGDPSPRKAGRYECTVENGQISTIVGFDPPA